MVDVILFHHAQGLTPGVHAFAEQLRAGGHRVTVPDLYEGRTFTDLTEGVGHAEKVGFDTIIERGRTAAEGMSDDVVYAGFSLGVMPAQMLAQTRPGARGALLLHSSVPLAEFGGQWPRTVPLQIHTMEDDDWGDVDVARDLATTIDGAELFLYPGDRHLFTDASLPDYDEGAATLLMPRVLRFLDEVGS